ncbi:MAG: DUF697 domain-containing protein [bacterium]
MSRSDEDLIVGMPVMGVQDPAEVKDSDRKRNEKSDPARRSVKESPQTKEQAPEVGQPLQAPERMEPLTEKQRREIKELMEQEEYSRARQYLDGAGKVPGFRIPAFMFRPTFVLLVIALAGVFFLFVFTQLLSLFQSLQQYGPLVQYVGYGAMGLLLLALLLAGMRIAYLYLRLSRNRQVSIPALSDLAKREELRELSEKELARGRKNLAGYLEKYPLESKDHEREFLRIGFREEEIERLRGQRRALLDEASSPGAEEWMQTFRNGFQEVLDTCASRRIKSLALRGGIKSAIIPISIVDTIIILYTAFVMIGDLCRIYNLRMGALSTAVIMGRAFIHAYLAGEIEEVSEKLFDSVFDSQEFLSQLAGAVAPRLVEGKANAFLLYRLGRSTTKLLRPVRPD